MKAVDSSVDLPSQPYHLYSIPHSSAHIFITLAFPFMDLVFPLENNQCLVLNGGQGWKAVPVGNSANISWYFDSQPVNIQTLSTP